MNIIQQGIIGTTFATKGGLLFELFAESSTTHLDVGTTKRSALVVDDCVSVNGLDLEALENVDKKLSTQFSGEILFELLLVLGMTKG